jgi:hypothetical protein
MRWAGMLHGQFLPKEHVQNRGTAFASKKFTDLGPHDFPGGTNPRRRWSQLFACYDTGMGLDNIQHIVDFKIDGRDFGNITVTRRIDNVGAGRVAKNHKVGYSSRFPFFHTRLQLLTGGGDGYRIGRAGRQGSGDKQQTQNHCQFFHSSFPLYKWLIFRQVQGTCPRI